MRLDLLVKSLYIPECKIDFGRVELEFGGDELEFGSYQIDFS